MPRRLLHAAVLTAVSASAAAEPSEMPGGGPAAAPLSGASDGRDGVRVSLTGDGLGIESAGGRYSFDVGGRLHIDWARHSGDAGAASPVEGADLRRARIAAGGRVGDAWRFSGEIDFGRDDVSVTDLSVAYEVGDALRLTFGQQKQPYSLGLEMSSNDIPFVERGLDNALLAPFVGRALGVRVDASGARWFVAGDLNGEPIDDDDEGWGTAARFVVAPLLELERALHCGLRGAYREPAASATVRIRHETTSFSELSIVDTAAIGGVDNVTLVGPEAVFATGPFSVAAEYNHARIEHALGASSFDAWHVAATWSLTGESRAAAYEIRDGEFKRLAPTQNFSPGDAPGAWELAARYSSIDLSDGSIVGGEGKTITLGSNWYPNRNVRVMLDWTRVLESDDSTRAAAEGLDVLTLRAQITF